MYDKNPGKRIRAKRVQLGISQSELASLVGLSERTVNRIEVGLISINSIKMIDESCLTNIANALRTSTEYILHGELHSERSMREELQKMRKEGIFRSDEELKSLDKLAVESIRQRNNANIPLNREELLVLLEVMRGADGYQ